MALDLFWGFVQARNPLFHEGVSPPDVPRVTAEQLDRELAKQGLARQEVLRTLGLGLPAYDEKDFDFLPSTDRARLTELVHAFGASSSALRDALQQVPPTEAMFAERIVRARQLLRDTILLLEQDRYRSPDALRFGKQVEQEVGDLRPEIVDLRFLVGKDWSGDPAFFAWAFVAEGIAATDERLRAFSRRVRPLIEDAMYRAAKGYFCYLSFKFLGEEIPQDEEVAA